RGLVADVSVPAKTTVPDVGRTYDSLGRIINETVGVNSTVAHAFSDDGRAVTTQISVGGTIASMQHAYDGEGRLKNVGMQLGASGMTTIATYNYGVGIGGPLFLTYANGSSNRYSYDDKLRRTGTDVTWGTSAGPPNVIASLHDAFGA